MLAGRVPVPSAPRRIERSDGAVLGPNESMERRARDSDLAGRVDAQSKLVRADLRAV